MLFPIRKISKVFSPSQNLVSHQALNMMMKLIGLTSIVTNNKAVPIYIFIIRDYCYTFLVSLHQTIRANCTPPYYLLYSTGGSVIILCVQTIIICHNMHAIVPLCRALNVSLLTLCN